MNSKETCEEKSDVWKIIDPYRKGIDNIVANPDLRSYSFLPTLDLRILKVLNVKEFFIGSYELWDAFMQHVDRGPFGQICVIIEVPKLDYLEDESRAKREHKTTPIPSSSLMPLKFYVRNSFIDICDVDYIAIIFTYNTSLRAHKEHLREVVSTPDEWPF